MALHRTIIVSAALLSACAASPAREGASAAQQCATATFPSDDRIAAWSVDKFAGRYMHGTDALTVRRDGHRLLIEGWTLGTRQLTAPSVESWTWHDGCGAVYAFTLPPDGPGAWLKITMPDGGSSDWHR